MSIKQAIFVYGFMIVLGMVGLLLFVSRISMLNNELAEQRQIKGEIVRAQLNLTQQLNDLGALVTDWAGWDDPYEYITNQDDEFLEDNVNPEMMQAANLSLIAFLDNSGTVLSSLLIDPETAEEIPLTDTLQAMLLNQEKPLQFTTHDDFRLGLVWDGASVMMIGAYPIIGNSRSRPINGTLIMGRSIQSSTIDLGDKNYLTVSLIPAAEGFRGKSELFTEAILDHEPMVETSDDVVTGYHGIADVSENMSLLLKVEQPRTIVKQGFETGWSYGVLLLSLTGVFALLLFVIIDRTISRPLTTLQQELSAIVEKNDYTSRVKVMGLKEQKDVATGINQLMEMNKQLTHAAQMSRKKAEDQLMQIEAKNKDMEDTKIAIMNILDDERELEEQLRIEKAHIEEKIIERTKDLEVEQAKLKGSIENLPVGFMMVDHNGIPLNSNRAIKEIFDNQDIQSTLSLIKEWISTGDDAHIDPAIGLPMSNQEYLNIPFGLKYVSVSIAPITTTDEVMLAVRIGWVILVDDVTEEKMVQKSRDEFFSIASHELRTPLTAIRGNMALIRDYYPEVMKDESLAPIITDVHTASLRLIQIVNDFLDASRLELNKIQFEFELFDVALMAKKVVETEKVVALEKHIECSLQLENDQPQMVYADPARVEQILYNLVGNAVKFTKQGGVTVEVRLNPENKMVVRVTDTGAGIPPENHGLLFRKFQQAGASVFTREASEGSGMGLYISSLLAQGMHATIRLESSELGKGSVFVLELPIINWQDNALEKPTLAA